MERLKYPRLRFKNGNTSLYEYMSIPKIIDETHTRSSRNLSKILHVCCINQSTQNVCKMSRTYVPSFLSFRFSFQFLHIHSQRPLGSFDLYFPKMDHRRIRVTLHTLNLSHRHASSLRVIGVVRVVKVMMRVTGVMMRVTGVMMRVAGVMMRVTRVMMRVAGVMMRVTGVMLRVIGAVRVVKMMVVMKVMISIGVICVIKGI